MKHPLYKLVFASLRRHFTQNVIALLMMSLAFGFVTAATFMYTSMERLDRAESEQENSAAQAMLLDADPAVWAAMQKAFPLKAAGSVQALCIHDLGEEYQHMGVIMGYLDPEALLMSCFPLIEGNWPKAPGEIALSETTLMRLGAGIRVGESLTLSLHGISEGVSSGPGTEKAYRLTGIFREYTDEWSNGFQNESFYEYPIDSYPVLTTIPTALVAKEEAQALQEAFPGGKTSYFMQFADAKGNLMSDWGLISLNENTVAPFLKSLDTKPFFLRNGTTYNWHDREVLLYTQALRLAVGLIFGSLSVLLLGSGIASSFEMRLNQRRQQIGLIRAIGATRSQAVSLALVEALFLLIPSLFIGIGAGGLLAKWSLGRLSAILKRPYPFSFQNGSFFLLGLIICSLLLCFFALRPMLRLTRRSPVALLHLQVSGRKARKLKTARHLPKNPLHFLAARYRRMHRGRHVFPVLLLSACLALVMLVMNISARNQVIYEGFADEKEDLVTLEWYKNYSSSVRFMAPDPNFNPWALSPDDIAYISDAPMAVSTQAAAIPGVSSVSYAKTAGYPVLFLQPGQVTEYVQNFDVRDFDRAPQSNIQAERADAARQVGMPEDLYAWLPQSLSWLSPVGIVGMDDQSLMRLEDSLMAGEIDLPALQSGEAVLMGSSSYFKHPDPYGWDAGLTDKREGIDVYANDAFHVGDLITFGKLYVSYGAEKIEYKAVLKTARICGLVNENPGNIYTADSRFSDWDFPGGVQHMQVRLPLGDGYDAAYRGLDILAHQYSFQVYSQHAQKVASRQSFESLMFIYMMALALIGAMGLAMLVSNTWSRLTVRSREISLLRAVGMEKQKVKRLLYGEAISDGLWAAGLGALLGIAACGWYNDLSNWGVNLTVARGSLPWLRQILQGVPWGAAAGAFVAFPMVGVAVAAGWIHRISDTSIVAGMQRVE